MSPAPSSERSPSAQDGAGSALVLFSGGQDSTTCLAWALARYRRVETVGFDYGQRHAVELEQRIRILSRLRDLFPAWSARLGPDHVLDLRSFGAIGNTALTTERAIEADERGLPTTFVPGRNLAFLVYAAALADRRGLTRLVGGMGEADYSGYPDCRESTLMAMEQALRLGLERDFAVETPLMSLSKAGVWALAEDLGGEPLVDLIVEESHSCYLGTRARRGPGGRGCGECPACRLREAGWLAFRGAAPAESPTRSAGGGSGP